MQNKINNRVAYLFGGKYTTLVYCSLEHKDRNYSFECANVHLLIMPVVENLYFILNDPVCNETELFCVFQLGTSRISTVICFRYRNICTFPVLCSNWSLYELRQLPFSEIGCLYVVTAQLHLRFVWQRSKIAFAYISKRYCPLVLIIRKLPKVL